MEPGTALIETALPLALPVSLEHIAIRPGYCGGKPHLVGHRIKVQHIVLWHDRAGMSAAEIVAQHLGLTLADVHAALAYYHDHRAEIDADIRVDEEFVQQLRAGTPSTFKGLRGSQWPEPVATSG